MKKAAEVSLWALLFLNLGIVAAQATQNVLLVVIDDLGVDQVGYDFLGAGKTPNLANLAASGMIFQNAWSYPICSPARAALLTGRHPLRTGIGSIVGPDPAPLGVDEFTLPDLVAATHATAVFGKWQLSVYDEHPAEIGWDHYEVHHGHNQGGSWDYFEQTWTVNGVNEVRKEYLTESTVTSAVDWIEAQSGPWLAWVAPLSVHKPLHCPPAQLHSYHPCRPGDEITQFQAMTETLDTLLQRLFDAVDLSETTIFVISDNGTDGSNLVLPPYRPNRVKGTVYQGGVNVPFIAAGSGVVPGVSTSLVQAADLFETVATLTGSVHEVAEIDSIDISPILADPLAEVRDTVFTETFEPNFSVFPDHDSFQMATRNSRYKLLLTTSGSAAFFDLDTDPLESSNLLPGPLEPGEQLAFDELKAYVQELKLPPVPDD